MLPALMVAAPALAGAAARLAPTISRIATRVASPIGASTTLSLAAAAGAYSGKASNTAARTQQNYNQPVRVEDNFRMNPADASSAIPKSGTTQTYQDALATRTNQSMQDAIGRTWGDADDVMKDASGTLKGYKSYLGKIGEARQRYLEAAEGNRQKQLAAIAGNRELIARNQTTDLRGLADRVRSGIFGTNIALGAAAGSSASQAAAKAYQRNAAKERAATLTGYGDQISAENQNEANTHESYNLSRDRVYQWEEQTKAQAIESYNQAKKVLDRLKSKMPDWKQEDLDKESDARFRELVSGLGSITAQARALRDELAGNVFGIQNEVDALREQGINIDTPAELDTQQFDDTLDISGLDGEDTYTESFYNPNVKAKKREGQDIFGNPLVFEEA